MKIYIASSFTLMNNKKAERYIYMMYKKNKMIYNRLQSFYFYEQWKKGFLKIL